MCELKEPMFFKNISQVKKSARALQSALQAKGMTVSLGEALDTLSSVNGYKDWNAFSATFSEQAVNQTLDSFELAHVYDSQEAELRLEESGGTGFGPENTLVTHTGFSLKSSAVDEELDYVRVCDPLGREIAYWSVDEIREAPGEVMGAIVGALLRSPNA